MGRRAGCSVPLCLLLFLLQVSHGMGRQDRARTLPGAAGPCSGPCPVLKSLSGQSGQRLCQRAASCQPGFTAETFALTVPRDSVAAGRALGRGKDTGTSGYRGQAGLGWLRGRGRDYGYRGVVGQGWAKGDMKPWLRA